MSLARRPAINFILIGVALFVLERAQRPAERVSVPAGRLAQLRAEFIEQMGAPPSPAQDAALVARALDEEILYREATAQGLDRNDPAIRHRLVEKMRFLNADDRRDDDALYREAVTLGLDREDVFVRRALVAKMRLIARRAAAEHAPDEAALQAYLERHADRYRLPARLQISQVFLSRARRGPALERDAAAALAALRSPTPPGLAALGDPFPIAPTAGVLTARELEKLFGTDFASRVKALEPGVWADPIPSAYGLHLVRVEARQPERMPSIASVRGQVERALREEQGEVAYAAFLQRLRKSYDVDIGGLASRVRSGGEG